MSQIDPTKTTGFFGHPKGLQTLFFTEMWERFSYYGMRAILVLFMTTPAAQEGLGLTTETSGAIYGLYTAGVYLLTLPGGWLADNIFGQRKAIWYGGILIMIGHLILAIPGSPGIFFTGLAFVASGTGLLKPNISTIVGDLYPEGGARRDAGFSVFYMGINLGSFLGQTFVALLGEKVNWHLGFGLAAIGMLAGLIQYRLTQGNLGDLGIEPKAKGSPASENSNPKLGFGLAALLVIILLLLQYTGKIDMFTAVGIASAVGVIIVTVTIFYFIYILVAGGLSEDEKKKVVIIFMLFVGAAIFWSGFEQAGSSLNLFARDHTDRMLFGWELPAGWLQNINPAFIIILAPMIGSLWIKLAARQMNPATPYKFAIGLIFMALGFLVMVFAAQIVATGAKAGMGWLIVTYLFHSTGELALSPVGLSATTKLAPRKYLGQMMGIWFVGAALGNLIAGLYAGNFDPEKVEQMPDLFKSVVWLGIGSGIMFFILGPWMRKWMGSVDKESNHQV
ncbi:MAG: peptide MFS transporter [Saprospiraceae bacterium]|nr:peptide MFS transporter [Saprospiraceae bacterium]